MNYHNYKNIWKKKVTVFNILIISSVTKYIIIFIIEFFKVTKFIHTNQIIYMLIFGTLWISFWSIKLYKKLIFKVFNRRAFLTLKPIERKIFFFQYFEGYISYADFENINVDDMYSTTSIFSIIIKWIPHFALGILPR